MWEPAWIEIHWNNIWLRARSHMASHYTWRSVTTPHDFGGVLGRPLDTSVWALTSSWSWLLACVWSGPKLLLFKGRAQLVAKNRPLLCGLHVSPLTWHWSNIATIPSFYLLGDFYDKLIKGGLMPNTYPIPPLTFPSTLLSFAFGNLMSYCMERRISCSCCHNIIELLSTVPFQWYQYTTSLKFFILNMSMFCCEDKQCDSI